MSEVDSNSPEYLIWAQMVQRCTNPNQTSYKNYGGRGITLYQEWQQSFTKFITHVGPRPTPDHVLDRINNEEGYFPGNVRWVTRPVQNRNKRNNVIIEYDGRRMILADWASFLGISKQALWLRLSRKWPLEKALSARKDK